MPGLLRNGAAIMEFRKRGTMKSVTTMENRQERRRSLGLRFFALAATACLLVTWLMGCNGSQPGETKAEVSRRHDRNLRLNSQMMKEDIDKTLMLDRPSRLTDKRVP
jgi:hypothetical protein